MKASFASVVVAIVLAGTFSAHAQNTQEGVAAPKAGAAPDSGSQRVRTRRDAEDAAGDAGDTGGAYGSSLPRLPSVFRNCEEPLPRYCQPYRSIFYWGPPYYRGYHYHHHHRY